MAHYKVILAYDGTCFQGFQRQVGTRTVQGEVEAALKQLQWQGKSILSAGRTDTGVHAAGQVIAFDLDWRHGEVALCNALNAHLPEDVVARGVKLELDGFHPRYDATGRSYHYHIFSSPVRDPLRQRFAMRVDGPLDLVTMQAAANCLLGSHDFSPFGTPPRVGGSTIREVTCATWYEELHGAYRFEIQANAFLYHMVRRLVFLLVLVGLDRLNAEAITRGIQKREVLPPGLAPSQGLILKEVYYHHEQVNNETT